MDVTFRRYPINFQMTDSILRSHGSLAIQADNPHCAAGNGGGGWVYYTLALGATGGPGIASVRNDPAHVFVPSEVPPNLGNWARPGVIPLRIESLSRHFQLRLKLPLVRAIRFGMTNAPYLRRRMTMVASLVGRISRTTTASYLACLHLSNPSRMSFDPMPCL